MLKYRSNYLGVLFFLALLFLCFAFSVATEDQKFTLPTLPQSRLADTHTMRLGDKDITSYLYFSAKEIDEIVDFYRDYFSKKEFRTIFDKKEGLRQLLRFQKDDWVVGIAIEPKENENQIVIAQYVQPKGSPPPEKTRPAWKDLLTLLPQEDQSGEDLRYIPRPPQSVRLSGINFRNQTFLTYVSKESAEQLRQFYEDEMFRLGWEMFHKASMEETVKFYKENSKKKNLAVLKLPFPDITFENFIAGGYILYYKGYGAQAQLSIFNNNTSGKKQGSFVQIKYVEETAR